MEVDDHVRQLAAAFGQSQGVISCTTSVDALMGPGAKDGKSVGSSSPVSIRLTTYSMRSTPRASMGSEWQASHCRPRFLFELREL